MTHDTRSPRPPRRESHSARLSRSLPQPVLRRTLPGEYLCSDSVLGRRERAGSELAERAIRVVREIEVERDVVRRAVQCRAQKAEPISLLAARRIGEGDEELLLATVVRGQPVRRSVYRRVHAPDLLVLLRHPRLCRCGELAWDGKRREPPRDPPALIEGEVAQSLERAQRSMLGVPRAHADRVHS